MMKCGDFTCIDLACQFIVRLCGLFNGSFVYLVKLTVYNCMACYFCLLLTLVPLYLLNVCDFVIVTLLYYFYLYSLLEQRPLVFC